MIAAWDHISQLTPGALAGLAPFICSICFDVSSDPAQPAGCTHIFCRSCLQASLRVRPSCPTCRASAAPDAVRRASAVAEVILAAAAKCPRCPAELPLSMLPEHQNLHQAAELTPGLQVDRGNLIKELESARAELKEVLTSIEYLNKKLQDARTEVDMHRKSEHRARYQLDAAHETNRQLRRRLNELETDSL